MRCDTFAHPGLATRALLLSISLTAWLFKLKSLQSSSNTSARKTQQRTLKAAMRGEYAPLSPAHAVAAAAQVMQHCCALSLKNRRQKPPTAMQLALNGAHLV
jgi:hypothetical protein